MVARFYLFRSQTRGFRRRRCVRRWRRRGAPGQHPCARERQMGQPRHPVEPVHRPYDPRTHRTVHPRGPAHRNHHGVCGQCVLPQEHPDRTRYGSTHAHPQPGRRDLHVQRRLHQRDRGHLAHPLVGSRSGRYCHSGQRDQKVLATGFCGHRNRGQPTGHHRHVTCALGCVVG